MNAIIGTYVISMCRWIYWTDYGTDKIERASMDGTSKMVLHSTNLMQTYTIALDYENQVLYWADFALNKIESSNVDGSNRRTLTTTVRDPFTMAYFNGRLYWTDAAFRRVLTGTVTSPGSGTFLGGGLSYDSYGIHVVSRDAQPLGNNHNKIACMYTVIIKFSYQCQTLALTTMATAFTSVF